MCFVTVRIGDLEFKVYLILESKKLELTIFLFHKIAKGRSDYYQMLPSSVKEY